MILAWGVFAILCGLVASFGQLLAVRFFLGVAEGGIWPAMLVFISHWFPRSERARAYGFWMTNLAIASIITQPLSGFIVAHATWRWLFIVEGVLPFVVAAPMWCRRPKTAGGGQLDAGPRRARVHRATGRGRARRRAETPFRASSPPTRVAARPRLFPRPGGLLRPEPVAAALLEPSPRPASGAVGLLAAIPYVVAIVFLWLNGRCGRPHAPVPAAVSVAMAVASISLVLSVVLGHPCACDPLDAAACRWP